MTKSIYLKEKKRNDQEYEHIINKWRNINGYRIFEKPLTHVWFSIDRIILDASHFPEITQNIRVTNTWYANSMFDYMNRLFFLIAV